MITREVVEHVAALAKLSFSEDEMAMFIRQFQDIVQYVDRLSQVDTSGVDPFEGRAVGWSLLREDRAEEWTAREESLKNAPDRVGDFFGVPRVVDKGDAHGAP